MRVGRVGGRAGPTPWWLVLAWVVGAAVTVPTGRVAAQVGSAGTAPGSTGVLAPLGAPPLDGVHWGVLAVEAGTGTVLAEWHADRRFIPASNAKVPVAAAALDRLGPGHRFRTELLGLGRLDARGVLHGDLLLPGSGDPTLSRRFWPDDVAPLRALTDSLRAAGVRRVTGALVVDASRWDSTSVPGSWMVEDLPGRFSATGGAFAVGEGETEIVVRGGAVPGTPVAVSWSPRGTDGFVVSYLRTVPRRSSSAREEDDDRVRVSYLPERRALELRGGVEPGEVDTLEVATRDPVRQAAAALHRALVEGGVAVDGGWRVVWDQGVPLGPAAGAEDGVDGGPCLSGDARRCDRALRLAALESPPLSAVVAELLGESQNWITEQLVRTLGASDTTRASWEHGLTEVERWVARETGSDTLDIELQDGSGMSAYSVVTPRVMVRLLEAARHAPWGEALREGMAEPGEDESTLEYRLAGLRGRLWAKTGTLTNVNSLSGYLVTDDGREVAFAVLSNGSGLPARRVRAAIDAVVEGLAMGIR